MTPTARRTTMVQVAGTAGGVGTTTAAALIFAALSQDVLGAPQLYDHAAGELGLRLPEGDEVRLVPVLGCMTAEHMLPRQWSGSPIRITCWLW
jgi:hypothetical protein